MSLPIVILIDIDGTLIGDITPQVCEWEIINRFDKQKVKLFKKHLIDQLKDGLLRPGFSTFVDQVKLSYPNAEFFLYTASEAKWAGFLVPCIEYVSGVKFQRPIFTRQQCIKDDGDCKKSIAKIAPTMYKKIKDKYNVSLQDMMANTILIDNTKVLLKAEERRLLLCPTYSHVILRDVTKLLDYDIIKNNYQTIANIMIQYNMFPNREDRETSLTTFMALTYKHLYQLISHVSGKKCVETDNFWYLLGSLFTKYDINSFRDALVKGFNEKIKLKT